MITLRNATKRFAELNRKEKKRFPLSRFRGGERFDNKAERWGVDAKAANQDQGSF